MASGSSQSKESQQPQEQPQINPDRPQMTNATYTVPKKLAQVEMGAQYARVPVAGDVMQTPVSLRVGLSNWFEGRLETAGVTREKETTSETTTDFGGMTLGGKFRVWATPGGLPAAAIMPAVTFPWGRGADSGTDVFVRFLTGRDLPAKTHLDINYGVGAVATGTAHYVQHMFAVDGTLQVGSHWNPFAEVYWFSKIDPEGDRALAMDAGASYLVNLRTAVDVGVAFGLTGPAGHPEVFGGLSYIVGEISGHRGVYSRLREAQMRGDR